MFTLKKHKHSIQRYLSIWFIRPGHYCFVLVRSHYRLEYCQNLVDGKKWESSNTAAKYSGFAFMSATSTSQSLRLYKVNFTWKKKGKKRKPPLLTGQFQLPHARKYKIPQTKTSFKSLQTCTKPQYQTIEKGLNFSKCGETIHRPCFNCSVKRFQCKNCKGMDISQVSVSILILRSHKLTFI